MRHSETETGDFDVKDIDRQLTADGEVIASKMGKLLLSIVPEPDHISCSVAARTKQTAALITEQLQFNPVRINFSEDLYEASARILLRVVNQMQDDYSRAIIIGHNPSISYLAEYLTGSEIGNVSPAGVVHLKFDGSWAEASERNMDLVQYYDPSMLS